MYVRGEGRRDTHAQALACCEISYGDVRAGDCSSDTKILFYELSDAGAIQPFSSSRIDRGTGERFHINIGIGEMIGAGPFTSSR